MSNYKKKQEAQAAQEKWELENPGQTKRDQEIIGSLFAIMQQQHIPTDKNKMKWFHAGAVWADENPARWTKYKLLAIGCVAGMIIGIIMGITIMVCR